MQYTVQQLAQMAGVSARTLRYYDEIGLLKPDRDAYNGYRIYTSEQVDRLQQILFYREMGVGLDEIAHILNAPDFDAVAALRAHKQRLEEEIERMRVLVRNVERTIGEKEGKTEMSDTQKFEGFKKALVDENEAKYGKEARAAYGDETVDASNRKVLNMTQAQYEEVQALEQQMMDTLAEAFATGNPAGELGQKAAALHKQWLCYYWPKYDKQAHAGLAQTYVEDERFRKYYDKEQDGMAEFLRDAIVIYTK